MYIDDALSRIGFIPCKWNTLAMLL